MTISFAAAKKSKKKECKKGYPCGNSCIARQRSCRKPLEGQAASFADWLKLQGSSSTSKSPTKQTSVAKKLPSAKSSNQPSFKPKKFNPHAIEDLSFAEFEGTYLKYKKAVANREYEQQRLQDKFDSDMSNPVYGAKFAISSAIQSGLHVPDSVVGKTKLNKTLRSQNEKNKIPDPEIEKLRKKAEPIIKAIEHPLVSEQEGKGHKPTLSKEEAAVYTEGSFAAGLSFYHGNPTPVVRSIAEDGADPELNDDGYFGKGTYFGTARSTAEGYMARGVGLDTSGKYVHVRNSSGKSGKEQKKGEPEMALIEIKTKVKNPFIATSADLDSNVPGNGSNLNEFMRAKGYDSIYVKDMGYFVAFDTKQVAVVDKQEYKVGDPETTKIINRHTQHQQDGKVASRLLDKEGAQFRTSATFENRVQRFTPTGKAMSKVKSSRF